MIVLKFISFLVRLLPLGLALWLGSILGAIAYWLIPSRRKIALENIQKSLYSQPPTPDSQLASRRIAKSVARNMGQNAMEFLRLPSMDRAYMDKHIEWVGQEHLDNALKLNRGVFILTAHLGNWDLVAAAIAMKGYPPAVPVHRDTAGDTRSYSAEAERPKYKVNIITKHLSVNVLNNFWLATRAKMNITQLYREGSLKQIITALKNNELMGFILDQHTHKSEGVAVDFFGRPAWTATSLAVLAQRYNVPVVPCFIIRKSGGLPAEAKSAQAGNHKIIFEPAVSIPEVDLRAPDFEKRATQIYTKILEKYIRQYPEQWIWMHRRWK